MRKFWGSAAMITATVLWGVSFSAQSSGMRFVEPILFTTLRSLVGFLALAAVIVVTDLCRGKRMVRHRSCRRKYLSAIRSEIYFRRENRFSYGSLYRHRPSARNFFQAENLSASVGGNCIGSGRLLSALRRNRQHRTWRKFRYHLCGNLLCTHYGHRPLCGAL